MKKELIIFQDTHPKNQTEIKKSIEHFCREHSLEYHFLPRKGAVCFYMDGEFYKTKIEKETLDGPAYWMIRCQCQSKAAKA